MGTIVDTSKLLTKEKSKFYCPSCNKGFGFSGSMKIHMKMCQRRSSHTYMKSIEKIATAHFDFLDELNAQRPSNTLPDNITTPTNNNATVWIVVCVLPETFS